MLQPKDSSRAFATRLLVTAAVAIVWLVFAGSASAGHFPWDQGHDTFQPDPGEDPDPGPCKDNTRGSPFEVATGNFVHTAPDLRAAAAGPDLEVIRTYNSQDMRSGMFGHGWSFTYGIRLVETTDGESLFALCRRGDGKRERFVRNEDGSYTTPPTILWQITQGEDGSFTLVQTDGIVDRFDADGRLVEVVAHGGHGLTLGYDATGFLTTVTDSRGRKLRFTKGPNGKVQSITDPDGGVHRYEYDDDGNLIAFTDAGGNIAHYAYDDRHNLVEVTDARGRRRMSYDERGRVASYSEPSEDGEGPSWQVEYDPGEGKTVKRDADENTFIYWYNENGNITSIRDPQRRDTKIGYNEVFMPVSVETGGRTCTMTYDAKGNVTTLTDAAGQLTFEWHPVFDRLIRATDRAGNEARYDYDESGNLVMIDVPRGGVARLSYDADGRLVSLVDSDGNSLPVLEGLDDPTDELDQLARTYATCHA